MHGDVLHTAALTHPDVLTDRCKVTETEKLGLPRTCTAVTCPRNPLNRTSKHLQQCWLRLSRAAALEVRLMCFWGTNNQLHIIRFSAVVYKRPVLKIFPLPPSFYWLLWCFDVRSSCFQAKGGCWRVSDVKMWCWSIAPAPAQWRTLTA